MSEEEGESIDLNDLKSVKSSTLGFMKYQKCKKELSAMFISEMTISTLFSHAQVISDFERYRILNIKSLSLINVVTQMYFINKCCYPNVFYFKNRISYKVR